MLEERSIKKRREKRANSSADIQPMALESAVHYFINAKIGEGIRDRTRDDYSNTWRYFTGGLNEENYELTYVHEITTEIWKCLMKELKSSMNSRSQRLEHIADTCAKSHTDKE